MDYETFFALLLPMLAGLFVMATALAVLYCIYRLMAWAWLHIRFWLWRRRYGR